MTLPDTFGILAMNATYITGSFDVAELTFFLFFFFFIGLVLYLNRESRREGYPLEDEYTGKVESMPLMSAEKKVFKLPHGRGTYVPEDMPREPVDVPAQRAFHGGGAPYVPTGNPMKDGLGPAAWANRKDYPDLTFDGRPRIVPIGDAHEIEIAPNDPDIIGWPVYDCNVELAGKVSDIWVDQSEHIIRYLEIETNAGEKVLAPIFVAVVQSKGLLAGLLPPKPQLVQIDAITKDQFADVPRLATAGQITRLEEDKIMAYYGGGYMYATPERSEPVI
ncbi:MAG: photosynthetic reaction center subunit H [Erythrobacter sp.]|uniref:photosynthetic reaction center subunit H n=1 Tax=Erythrobacter sp. TaxID=1042 RepID=UPI0026327CC5|nr:photosynthetic reaction center subunit H [Erythrobacter sp.]MDJ0979617.1 photosynthetic reaction center subunit H [Erythrobacter sp.]